jgi:hypothetical protein
MTGAVLIALVIPAILTVDSATEPLIWGLMLLGVGLSAGAENIGRNDRPSGPPSDATSRHCRCGRCVLE